MLLDRYNLTPYHYATPKVYRSFTPGQVSPSPAASQTPPPGHLLTWLRPGVKWPTVACGLAIKRDVQLLVAALLRNNLGQMVVHTLVPVVKKHFSTSVKKPARQRQVAEGVVYRQLRCVYSLRHETGMSATPVSCSCEQQCCCKMLNTSTNSRQLSATSPFEIKNSRNFERQLFNDIVLVVN